MSGEAMAMRVALAKLAVHHGIAPKPCIIPLSDPVDYPVVVEGYASTVDIDLDRTRFRAYAFCNPFLLLKGYDLPPLLYKHDPEQVAGKIESLGYDDRGNLRIRATVDHPLARRCGAFSIRGKVLAYELRDTECRNFHALVTSAELIEISLTDTPANVNARVQHRYRAAPVAPLLNTMAETNALLIKGVGYLQQMAEIIADLARASAAPAKPPPAPRRTAGSAPASAVSGNGVRAACHGHGGKSQCLTSRRR
jgi:HK97 family phage prohead protease